MCSPGGSATMNSLMKVATFRLEITSHSHSLTERTEAGTRISMSPFTFTWQARRQWFFSSLRVKWTASVGRASPPPCSTCRRHCPQLPLPPHADGRKTLLSAMVDNSDLPDCASTFLSPFIVIVTAPVWTRYFLAIRSIITSSSVTPRKNPTPAITVVVAVDWLHDINVLIMTA